MADRTRNPLSKGRVHNKTSTEASREDPHRVETVAAAQSRPPAWSAFQPLRAADSRFFWRIRFLVALTPVWDLFLFANYLFVPATMAWRPPQMGPAQRNCVSMKRIVSASIHGPASPYRWSVRAASPSAGWLVMRAFPRPTAGRGRWPSATRLLPRPRYLPGDLSWGPDPIATEDRPRTGRSPPQPAARSAFGGRASFGVPGRGEIA